MTEGKVSDVKSNGPKFKSWPEPSPAFFVTLEIEFHIMLSL